MSTTETYKQEETQNGTIMVNYEFIDTDGSKFTYLSKTLHGCRFMRDQWLLKKETNSKYPPRVPASQEYEGGDVIVSPQLNNFGRHIYCGGEGVWSVNAKENDAYVFQGYFAGATAAAAYSKFKDIQDQE